MGALADGFLSRVWVAMVNVDEVIELLRRGRRCREDNGKSFCGERSEIVEETKAV